jgi:hypothetical protein
MTIEFTMVSIVATRRGDFVRGFPALREVVSKLRMCDLKEDLNAEDAEVFAKARREAPYFAYLCENLCALCV